MSKEVEDLIGEWWFSYLIRAITMEFHFDDHIKEAKIQRLEDAPGDWVSIEYGRYILKYDYDKNIIFVG